MEIKSVKNLPFLFKDFKEGILSENPLMFSSKDGNFKQSLTEKQYKALAEFNANKKAEAPVKVKESEIAKVEETDKVSEGAEVVESVTIEADQAKAEIAVLEKQAKKMQKNSAARKKLEKRIKELKG